MPAAEAARVLAGRFGVSVRQARRYADRAGASTERAAFAFLLDDGEAVTRVVASVREALARRPDGLRAAADAPLPLPAVRWSSLREVARRAGLELGPLGSFPEPRPGSRAIRSVADVIGGAGRQDLRAPRS